MRLDGVDAETVAGNQIVSCHKSVTSVAVSRAEVITTCRVIEVYE